MIPSAYKNRKKDMLNSPDFCRGCFFFFRQLNNA